jgi:hypothetical protein
MRQPADQEVMELLPELAFGDGADWVGGAASILRSNLRGLSKDNIDSEMIEDESYRIGPGSHGHFEGVCLAQENDVPCDVYLSGHDAAVGIGASPVMTFQAAALRSWAQCEVIEQDGLAVAAGCTTTLVKGVGGTFDPQTWEPLVTSRIGLALIRVTDGGVASFYVRPYVWLAADGGTLSLLMALPAAPDNVAGDYVCGGLCWRLTQDFVNPVAHSLGVRWIGNSDEQNAELLGAVLSSWSIGEITPKQVPTLSLKWRAAGYDEPAGLTRIRPASDAAQVAAGSSVLLAARGSTVVHALRCSNVAVESGAELVYDPDFNGALGCGGFSRAAGLPSISLTVPDLEVPPAACTAAGWRAMFRNNKIAGNELQALVLGLPVPGRVNAAYFPTCIVTECGRTSDNRAAIYKLKLEPTDNPRYATTSCQSMLGLIA